MVIKQLQQGVTLIEMLVVVAIVAVVSSVIVFNYSDFSTNVSVRALAQDVALGVRKAQTYATSVRSIEETGLSTSLYPVYGISFSADQAGAETAPTSKRFVLFADVSGSGGPGDGMYDTSGTCGMPTAGSECVEVFTITTADKVARICSDPTPGQEECFTDGSARSVNVTFRRPSPDAHICVDRSGICSGNPSYAKIVLQSAKGLEKIITIWNTGQISVN